MVPPISNRWTTHPDYIDLLNYVIQKAKDAKSPKNIQSLAKEFKEKRGAAQTVSCLMYRIITMRTLICSFEHIDTNTKVILIFALSASIDRNFLKDLKKDALVDVDDEKRISHYKANDGSLELSGDHSLSAKIRTAMLESKQSTRSMIINYFETKDDANAIPENKEEKEMGNLIEFISEKCLNVDKPINIRQLMKDFNSRFGISIPLNTIRSRVEGYCREIQKVEFLDTQTKVQQLFGLSATVDSDYLEKLRKDAIVKIDDKNRITFYKATNGSLELTGDHSMSAKVRTAKLESKGSIRSLINNYFETKDEADAIPTSEEEKEMWNLIEFITEKCVDVDKPINICQLAKDFKIRFGISVLLETIQSRVRGYCREIQKIEFVDTPTKVQQLFGLSATVDSDYLEKLRKDAVVEVDDLNRITKYTANNGRLNLNGDHSTSAKRKLAWIEKKKKRNAVEKHSNFGGDEGEESEKEDGYSGEDSDEYSSEEFGSEFDSDDENVSLDEPYHIDTSDEVLGSDNETGNPSVKTRSGKLSKRRHLNSEVSYNQANSSSLECPMSSDSLSRKPAKQKKSAIEKEQASNSSNESRDSSRSMRRFSRNSPFPPTSTDLEEKMESEDAPRAVDCDDESLMRNESPAGVSMDDNFDFDPPTERTPQPEEIEMREDVDNDTGLMRNTPVETKSGRLSKRKHFDSNFSNNSANSSCSGASTNANSIHSKHAKQKKRAIEKEQASNSSNESRDSSRSMRRFSRNSPFPSIPVLADSDEKEEEELGSKDVTTRSGSLSKERVSDMNSLRSQIPTSPICETPESSERNAEICESSSSRRTRASTDDSPNHSIDESSRVQLKPFRGSIQENLSVIERENDIQQIQRPTEGLQALDEHNQIEEVPIKLEREGLAEVKPKTSHNSKIKFFEAMQSLILFLDTPSLSNLQSKIHQKIRKLKGSKEVFHNNEVIPAMEFMIAKITNHSTASLPKTVESVSLSHFLCLLKAAILNSKLAGLDSLLERIRKLNKELHLQTKSVPVKTLAHVLQTTMDNIGF